MPLAGIEVQKLRHRRLGVALPWPGQPQRTGRPPQGRRPVPRLHAAGPNQVWSWVIIYLVLDVWSRKVVAWDNALREDPAIAADLISGS